MNPKEIEYYSKAGRIAKQVKEYAKSIIKKGTSLLEIAEKIESKIIELNGEIAFPVNLSIDDVAAHYTPSYDDKTTASGLLKVDIGVHVNGYISDTAFSVDLENNDENKKLILAAEQALEQAIKTIKKDIEIWKIGEVIQKTIIDEGFSPVINLSGHGLSEYNVHSGITIPNCNNNNSKVLETGAYAVEPFATTGQGMVYDGKPSGIYQFIEKKAIRDNLSRKIIEHVEKNYRTLPFCSRWIIKEFGTRALLSLNLLEKAGIVKQFSQLVEKSHKKVSQAELSVIITEKKVEVLD